MRRAKKISQRRKLVILDKALQMYDTPFKLGVTYDGGVFEVVQVKVCRGGLQIAVGFGDWQAIGLDDFFALPVFDF